jgi:hypothetical protein
MALPYGANNVYLSVSLRPPVLKSLLCKKISVLFEVLAI